MTESYQPAAGTWWRFSQYEISDGRIRPAPGAALEQYDPWEEYEASREHGAGNAAEPPYQSLVRLATTATLDSRGRATPTAQDAILSWCTKYGLLGIVPQSFIIPAGSDIRENEEGHAWLPSYYTWERGRWLVGRLRLAVDRAQMDKLAATLARFFPTVDHPEECLPSPATPAFWHEYAEPVNEFLSMANEITATLQDLSAPDRAELFGGMSFMDGELEPYESVEFLNEFTSTVAPVLVVGSDLEYRQVWRFQSLLAGLALMILRDLTEGRRVHKCRNESCGTLFLSARSGARYCSDTCQNTAQKRRQRERERTRRGQES